MNDRDEMVVLFDTVEESRRAEKALEAHGFPDPEVNTLDRDALKKMLGGKRFSPTFWKRLFGREVQLYEGAVFEKALATGGAVLTVRVHSDEDATKVETLLKGFRPVDLEARGTGVIAEHKALGDIKPEVLRLAEEQLEVGKRRVETGKTRIRRYVTERQVEAKVTLQEEHAEVIRNVVAEPAVVEAEWDWSDSTIEMVETREEAVASKTTRVTEEVALRRAESEREETIRDTVRKQEVEIEELDADGRPVGAK